MIAPYQLQTRIGRVTALVLGISLGVSAPGVAQQGAPSASPVAAAFVGGDAASADIAPGKYAVVIDLSANQLHFRQGRSTLWSAPIGTGTGLTLRGAEQEWDFSTPEGVFHVQHKAENPTWIVPDWYFIENNLPVPPPNDPKRRQPGGLGAAAVYLGHELAIHGTDKPELLGQRVSHGCIRLSNEHAIRLFHNVQVGTPVIIIGGERAAEEQSQARPASGATRSRGARTAPPRSQPSDPFAGVPTAVLLERIEEDLRTGTSYGRTARWPQIASQLVRRGLKGDDQALDGLLSLAGTAETRRSEREFSTFLADAYSRGPVQVLAALARLDAASRNRAAEEIVQATLALYSGSSDDTPTPWPTRRIPQELVDRSARPGWDAIRAAEQAHRSDSGRRSA